jgi:hypothetical protein
MTDDPHARPCPGPEPPEEPALEATRRNAERGESAARTFYREALATVIESGVPFLIGGAFALELYTGVSRSTKDLDIFVRPGDVRRVLEVFSAAGYRTELTDPQWLAKACSGGDFVDVVFGSANGTGEVDDAWFRHAERGNVLGLSLDLCPVEETIWSKAFVMERGRYDGADIAHLLRARCERLDWGRLLRRFGDLWQILFTHLVLFGFIYPSERARIPDWVMGELLSRLRDELKNPPEGRRLCRGTLLSPTQYLPDIEQWGYEDARVRREGP